MIMTFLILFLVCTVMYTWYWWKRDYRAVLKFFVKEIMPGLLFLTCICMLEYKYNYNPEIEKKHSIIHDTKERPREGLLGQTKITQKVFDNFFESEIYNGSIGIKEGNMNSFYHNKMDGKSNPSGLNFGGGNTAFMMQKVIKYDKPVIIQHKITKELYKGYIEDIIAWSNGRSDLESVWSQWILEENSARDIDRTIKSYYIKKLKQIDPEVLAHMDKSTIKGMLHLEYAAGGSLFYLAKAIEKNKKDVLGELKFNNGRFSEYFMDKWIMKDSINKGKNDISLAQLVYPPSWKGKDGNIYKRHRMVYFTGKGSSKTYTVKG